MVPKIPEVWKTCLTLSHNINLLAPRGTTLYLFNQSIILCMCQENKQLVLLTNTSNPSNLEVEERWHVHGQPGLYADFRASLGYLVRLCLIKTKIKITSQNKQTKKPPDPSTNNISKNNNKKYHSLYTHRDQKVAVHLPRPQFHSINMGVVSQCATSSLSHILASLSYSGHTPHIPIPPHSHTLPHSFKTSRNKKDTN